jgi:electron transfer flavoprotein alpha subunit
VRRARGGKQEDLALVEDLARALGAEMACTRPLAEGLDWLPRERYIGISGAMIRPDLYLGVGVSGQAQHAIGMHESRVVVAINKDSSAPIVRQADYISRKTCTSHTGASKLYGAKRT